MVDDGPQTMRYVRDVLTKLDYEAVVTGEPEDMPRLLEEHSSQPVMLQDLVFPASMDGIDLLGQRNGPMPSDLLNRLVEFGTLEWSRIPTAAFDLGGSAWKGSYLITALTH